ncbi:MAG TPA: hypothetical protein VK558_09815 [Patescibacteria group bacterium]|nr:hypothetical protein [Patescibacteria group bacterium]
MSPSRIALLAASSLLAATALASSAQAKAAPACAAINFRPVSGSPNDGTMDAGLYRSRFGTITLRAEVSGGVAHNYYIEINGKRPDAVKGALPAAVNPCLNTKHVKTPAPSVGEACTGTRFRVVIDTLGKIKYVMLFGLDGDTWKQCSASTV